MRSKATGHRLLRHCTDSAVHPSVHHVAAPKPIRILVADAQEIVRAGMRGMLIGQPDLLVVGESGTAADTLSEARRVSPDLVLMEARLPDGSGSEVCRLLLQAHPAIRIFMVTMSHSPVTFRAAAEAGVHGYVLKDIIRSELLRAIRAVAGGVSYLQFEMADQALCGLRDGLKDACEPRLRILSPQQHRVIRLVAEGKTNKEIAVELSLSDKTVKNYLANMFTKLQITRRTQAVSLYLQHCGSDVSSDVLPSL